MGSELAHLAPHFLGTFMITLACVPLVFIWQDRKRRQAQQGQMRRLRQQARVMDAQRNPQLGSAAAFFANHVGTSQR